MTSMTETKELEELPFELTKTDLENLAGGDEKFQPHNWEDLKLIIAENNLSILKRKPSDLRRYITWTNETKTKFPSITDFVCSQRLFWNPLPESTPETGPLFECRGTIPFADSHDYKILMNDWPYGLTQDITHLIVWSKLRLPEEKPEGYLTPESTALVKDFIERTFTERLASFEDVNSPRDSVLWFRNWTGLQSVRGLEHVHVLVRDAPLALLEEWTTTHELGSEAILD